MVKDKLQILVVEDNPMYQQMIGMQLQEIGNDIHYFSKGETCVEQMSGLCPDLLVLDYNLEGEMNGLDTLKQIRDQYPNTFAVVYSTEEGLNTKENFDSFGHFVFIEKKDNSITYLQKLFSCIQYSFLSLGRA